MSDSTTRGTVHVPHDPDGNHTPSGIAAEGEARRRYAEASTRIVGERDGFVAGAKWQAERDRAPEEVLIDGLDWVRWENLSDYAEAHKHTADKAQREVKRLTDIGAVADHLTAHQPTYSADLLRYVCACGDSDHWPTHAAETLARR